MHLSICNQDQGSQHAPVREVAPPAGTSGENGNLIDTRALRRKRVLFQRLILATPSWSCMEMNLVPCRGCIIPVIAAHTLRRHHHTCTHGFTCYTLHLAHHQARTRQTVPCPPEAAFLPGPGALAHILIQDFGSSRRQSGANEPAAGRLHSDKAAVIRLSDGAEEAHLEGE